MCIRDRTDSQAPVVSYATAYPVALILMTIVAKVIIQTIGGVEMCIRDSSNTTYSNAGLINNTAGKVIANYWLDQVYSAREGACLLYTSRCV